MTLASKSFRTEPQHFIAGDHVVVLTRITVDGQSADQADVLTVMDGRVANSKWSGDTALLQRVWGTK